MDLLLRRFRLLRSNLRLVSGRVPLSWTKRRLFGQSMKPYELSPSECEALDRALRRSVSDDNVVVLHPHGPQPPEAA